MSSVAPPAPVARGLMRTHTAAIRRVVARPLSARARGPPV